MSEDAGVARMTVLSTKPHTLRYTVIVTAADGSAAGEFSHNHSIEQQCNINYGMWCKVLCTVFTSTYNMIKFFSLLVVYRW